MQERFGNRPPEEFRDDQLRPEISPEFRGDFSEQERREEPRSDEFRQGEFENRESSFNSGEQGSNSGEGGAVVEKEVRAEAKEVSVGALFLVEQFLGKTQEIHS